MSGLTDVSDSLAARLQDEEALLYLLDVHDGTVMERHRFWATGDMEGLTRVKDGFYALRSDGLVYHLRKARAAMPCRHVPAAPSEPGHRRAGVR